MKRYIRSSRWGYTLKCGKDLRSAIQSEDPREVLTQLERAYNELRTAGLIDDDDYESYTEDFELYGDFSDWDDPEETIDYELSNFYDLCDNLGVWIDV